MLRWSVLLIGLASSGCVLGDGIDLPSTSGDGNGPTTGEGSAPDDGLTDGGSNGPPNDAGEPAGSGGSPCCEEPPVGDAGSFGGETP